MRFPCIVLFALAAWLAPLGIAQNSGPEELPSAPSATPQRPPEKPPPPQAHPKPGPGPQATPESKSSAAPVSAEDSKKPTESSSSETAVPAESNPARDADRKKLESKTLAETRDVDESLPTIPRRVGEGN